MTPKPESEVAPGSVWTGPAYGPDGVRHRGSASLDRAEHAGSSAVDWMWAVGQCLGD
jgi:hypothetical protein